MDKQLRSYRQAVREAIAGAWAAGLPAYQGRGGYLVALYPGGKEARLKKPQGRLHDGQRSTAKALAARRAERRGCAGTAPPAELHASVQLENLTARS